MVKCPQCGHEQQDNGACSECGVETVQTSAQSESVQNSGAVCSNCKAAMPQGSLFCSMCGTKVEEKPVTQKPLVVSNEELETAKVGQPVQGEQPLSPQQVGYPYPAPPIHEVSEAAKERAGTKKGSSKKTLIAAVSLAVVFLVFIGMFVLSQVGDTIDLQVIGGNAGTSGAGTTKNQDTDRPLIYLQDKDVLKFRTSGMDRSQVITDSFSNKTDSYSEWMLSGYLSWVSKDGNYLLYLNNYRQTSYYSYEGRGDLYIRDLTSISPQGETDIGIKIASDVSSQFYISDNNSYVFYITSKDDLYVWDFSETYKLDSNVTGIYDWTNDKIFYYKGDVDDYYISYFSTRDCYVAPLAKDGRDKREKVDTDINDVYDWNDDLTQFVYTKTASDGYTFDLYKQDFDSGKRESIVSDVAEVIDADLESGVVVFVKEQESTVFYEDIIEDDMLEQDATLQEPKMEDYPYLDWYYNEYNYYNDDEIDYDLLQEQFDAYEDAENLYAGKEKRERIRELINSELDGTRTMELYLYELYYIKDGETKKIDNDVYISSSGYTYDSEINYNWKQEFIAYQKADLKDLPRIKLSEMESSYSLYSFDMEDFISSNLTGEMYFVKLGGTPKLVVGKDDEIGSSTWNVVMSEEGTGVYFRGTDLSGEQEEDDSSASESSSSDRWSEDDRDWDDDYLYFYNPYSSDSFSGSQEKTMPYNLYYVPVEGNSFGQVAVLDKNIDNISIYQTYLGKNYYMTKGKKDQGDLYLLDGTDKERLTYDVSTYMLPQVYDDGEVILFYEDYDTNRYMGELCLIRNGEEKVRIAESVYEYYYYSDNMIYLLCSVRSGKGDLYLYDGEMLTLIDYDVTAVVDTWYWD